MGVEWSSPKNAGRSAPSSRPASRPPGGPRGAHFASHPSRATERGWPADDVRARLRRRWPAVLALVTGSQDRPHLRHAEFLDALARITHRTL